MEEQMFLLLRTVSDHIRRDENPNGTSKNVTLVEMTVAKVLDSAQMMSAMTQQRSQNTVNQQLQADDGV